MNKTLFGDGVTSSGDSEWTSATEFSKRVARPGPRSVPKPGISGAAGMFLLRNLLTHVIRKGSLTVIGPDGRSFEFGHAEPSVTVRIADWPTVRKLSLNPEVALGEAYMDSKVEIDRGSIYDLLDLCLANLGWDAGPWALRARAFGRRLGRRLAQHNPVGVSRANVAHHYDLSDTLYELFLDAGRQYSCAYYASPNDTLERAQEQKQRHIAAKLLLRPGQRVLDIGSGWGGLALHLARSEDVDVTGVTLSTEQHGYSSRLAADAGLGDRARFLLKDYRHEAGRYDRIVSVGMFEHVGVGHYQEYFKKIRDLLTEDGVALIHTIGSARGPGGANPWIHKYIFPGGHRAGRPPHHRRRGAAAALRVDS
jgi:cyclopropane-fatty-acyl-phospholipid synthase